MGFNSMFLLLWTINGEGYPRCRLSPWLTDTFHLLPGESYGIAFIVDNPGCVWTAAITWFMQQPAEKTPHLQGGCLQSGKNQLWLGLFVIAICYDICAITDADSLCAEKNVAVPVPLGKRKAFDTQRMEKERMLGFTRQWIE